jgi:hypothetical protein
VFWKSDRWGRSAAHVLTTVGELRHRGVRVKSLTENFDLDIKEGRFITPAIMKRILTDPGTLSRSDDDGRQRGRPNGIGRPGFATRPKTVSGMNDDVSHSAAADDRLGQVAVSLMRHGLGVQLPLDPSMSPDDLDADSIVVRSPASGECAYVRYVRFEDDSDTIFLELTYRTGTDLDPNGAHLGRDRYAGNQPDGP